MPATTREGGSADETDVRCLKCGEETVVRDLGSREGE